MSLKVTLNCREAEDCMPLVLHAKCHMSAMKRMPVDLEAEHTGVHVAPSAIIGQSMVMLSVMLTVPSTGHKNHLDTMRRHHRCYVAVPQATTVLILIRG